MSLIKLYKSWENVENFIKLKIFKSILKFKRMFSKFKMTLNKFWIVFVKHFK